MSTWDQALQSNKALWNELTAIHARGETYRMTAFKDGTKQLDPLVLAEVGEVTGKLLLHLQCHFGMDTLMWARLGARVTGVDFADEAITLARHLSDEIGMPATFIESNLYELPHKLEGAFDVVYTSWGVLNWLPDLTEWGQIIARYLAPGAASTSPRGIPSCRSSTTERTWRTCVCATTTFTGRSRSTSRPAMTTPTRLS